ncbi:MAG: pilus assembly protein N-terminal domain-containing protein [Pseudomonadota bacterium]
MRMILSAFAALMALTNTAHAGQIWLTMDQVRPLKLENPAQSIVVGNPAIADVTVQDNENILLFGKAPGLTNIYIFDEKGDAVENVMIRVRSSSADMLTMQRGLARTTYNCTNNCEPTLTVGDDQTVFTGVSAQVQNKLQQATMAAGNEN